MIDILINYDTALLAKEKGLDHRISTSGNLIFRSESGLSNRSYINAAWTPTQTLLQRWLRERHGIEIYIEKSFTCYNLMSITKYNGLEDKNIKQNIEEGIEFKDFKSYEKALEEGLFIALKLV